jgi:hypothetical protein
MWLVSLAMPGASYLAAWPLLFGLLPLAWSLLYAERAENSWGQVVVLAVAAFPAILLLPPTLYQVLMLLGRIEGLASLPLLGLTALFVAPLAGLFVPHLEFLAGGSRRGWWIVPGTAALVALLLIVWGNATSGFTVEHPRPDQIFYELNADSGQARWVSLDAQLDDWTGQFFPPNQAKSAYEIVPGMTRAAFVAPAPVASVPAPQIDLLSDTIQGEIRTLRLRLLSPRGAFQLGIAVQAGGEIVTASLDGRPLDLSEYRRAAQGKLNLTYTALPAEGAELLLSVRSTQPVVIRIEESGHGLPEIPGMAIQPRPAGFMPAPTELMDATIVVKTFELR